MEEKRQVQEFNRVGEDWKERGGKRKREAAQEELTACEDYGMLDFEEFGNWGSDHLGEGRHVERA